MERYYTANGRYVDADGNALTLPFTEVPKEGGAKYYDLSFSTGTTATTWTLQAAPKGMMSDDGCGMLIITNTGGLAEDLCWRR